MIENPETLRRRALKSRRLAKGVSDRHTIDALNTLADEYEARAKTAKPHLATSGSDPAEKNKPDVNADSPSKP